jgi:uncharacterized delta-60 repeat protein
MNARRFCIVCSGLWLLVSVGLAGAATAPHGGLDPAFNSSPGRVVGPGGAADALAIQSDGKLVVAGTDGAGFRLARYTSNGALDPTFGTGGVVTTTVSGASAEAKALVVQPDGKLVAAGDAVVSFAGNTRFVAVARYNPNGSLDTTFGNGGLGYVADVQGAGEALAVQPDGKLVVAGTDGSSFQLVRYTSSGSLDSTFGSGGVATTAVGSGPAEARGLVVQPDGKLVAAGSARVGLSTDFALVRYLPDGTPDSSFGANGVVTTPILSHGDDAFALALQSDGKLVAVGPTTRGSGKAEFALARYTRSGALDSTFGSHGIVTTPISNGNDEAAALAVQADGKLLAVGSSGTEFALVRYTKAGALDRAFDGDGIATTSLGSRAAAAGVGVQADGKLVAAGFSDSNFALVRYTKAGAIDAPFTSVPGPVVTRFGALDATAQAVAVQADGKVVATGYASGEFALARYNSDGSLDGAFGADGTVETPMDSGNGVLYALVVQPDGKLVAAGSVSNAAVTHRDIALVRYLPDGTLDTGFGNGGIALTPIGAGSSEAFALGLQKDGKLVAAGYGKVGTSNDFALVRYEADGTLDPTFGAGGIVMTPVGTGGDEARAVVVQPNGSIVAAGRAQNGSITFALARFKANGSLDTSFGGDGVVTTPIDGQEDEVYALALQKDGKLIAAGGTESGGNWDAALARYKSNGVLDPTFGGDGIVVTPVGSGYNLASGLVVQADGKLVTAGVCYFGSVGDFTLVRYTKTGDLDATFAGGGIVFTSIAGQDDEAYALALQKDGKLVAAGASYDGSHYDLALARYLP